MPPREPRVLSGRGMTIVEMVIVIVVVGAIFGLGALVLGRAFESYALTKDTTHIDWQGRVAMERMVRELRDLRSATAADLAFTSNPMSRIQFVTASGDPVCFYVSGGRLMRSADGPGSACGTTDPQPLADNVAPGGLSVSVFKNDGTDLVVPPDTISQAFFITLSLSVTDGALSETYRVTVQPRRL